MTSQQEKAAQFARLHVKGDPLVLYNIWDAGGAKAVEEAGAQAIATGSWSVAAANGFGDGEKTPFDLVLANLARIVGATALPVTLDIEGGYGVEPQAAAGSVAQAIAAGAIGINLEDSIIGGSGLYAVDAQAARIAAIRRAANESGVPLFINARSDVYLQAPRAEHAGDALFDETVQRAKAYADAGADGFFAPGLIDLSRIALLCGRSPLPVNIMYMGGVPATSDLAAAGVARLSYGANPYSVMMAALKSAAQTAFAWKN